MLKWKPQCALVAQWIARSTSNREAVGSSPTWGVKGELFLITHFPFSYSFPVWAFLARLEGIQILIR